jgi:ABC-type glycerol-3-phosphate transport system substrate-binding protein
MTSAKRRSSIIAPHSNHEHTKGNALMKRMRIAALAALVAVAAGALTGCTSGGASADAKQTISFTGSDNPSTYKPVITAFEKKYPSITVKYTQVPQASFSSTLEQRLGAKDSSIDVYTVDQPTVAELAAQGYLVDLSSLKSKLKPLVPADQYHVNLYKGKLWALPVWTSTQMLFYNKTALEKAGVPLPSSDPTKPLTWEQVASEGAQVQREGDTKSGLVFEQLTYYEMQPLAESAGGGSGITGSNGLGIDVTNPGWTKAMQWFGQTFSSGLSPRVPNLQGQPYFTDGKTAFYVGGPWDVGIFASSNLDWGIAPLPKFQGGSDATPTGSWSWGISPYSKHRAADLEFLEFASLNPAGNLATTQATTIIPSNTAAAAKYLPTLEKLGGDRSSGVANLITYANAHTAVARPTSVGYVQFEQLMDSAFSDISNGAPVSPRLGQAEQSITSAWKALL